MTNPNGDADASSYPDQRHLACTADRSVILGGAENMNPNGRSEMGTWNYRIVLHDEDPDPEKHWYGLHECYYEPTGWTENPTTFICDKDEGPEAIIWALERALSTLRKSSVVQPGDPTTWAP